MLGLNCYIRALGSTQKKEIREFVKTLITDRALNGGSVKFQNIYTQTIQSGLPVSRMVMARVYQDALAELKQANYSHDGVDLQSLLVDTNGTFKEFGKQGFSAPAEFNNSVYSAKQIFRKAFASIPSTFTQFETSFKKALLKVNADMEVLIGQDTNWLASKDTTASATSQQIKDDQEAVRRDFNSNAKAITDKIRKEGLEKGKSTTDIMKSIVDYQVTHDPSATDAQKEVTEVLMEQYKEAVLETLFTGMVETKGGKTLYQKFLEGNPTYALEVVTTDANGKQEKTTIFNYKKYKEDGGDESLLSNKIDSVDITAIKDFIVKAIDSKQIEKYKNESVKILNNAFANQNGVNKQNINKTEVEKLARLINAGLFSLNSADATRLLLRAMGDKEASAVFDKETYKSITDISNRIKNISEIAQGSEVLSQYAKELADELAKLIEDEKIEALQVGKRIAYKVVEMLQAVTGLSMAYKLGGAFTLAQNFATSIATGIANSARAFGNLIYGGIKSIRYEDNIPLKKAKYFGKALVNQIGATVNNDTDKSTSQRIGAKSFTGIPKNLYDIPRLITTGANNLANFITYFTGSIDRVARLTQFTNSFLSQLEEKIYNNIILKNPNISKGGAKKEAIKQFGAVLDAISEFTDTEKNNALDVVNYITGDKKDAKEFSPLKLAIAFQLAVGNTELYYALMEAEKVAKEVSSIMTGQKESSIGILSALPTIISVGENLAQEKINALVGETEFGTWSDIGKRMLKVLTNVALQFTKAGAIWQALTFLWNSKLGVFTSGVLAGSKYFGNTKAKKLDYLKSGKTVEQARKKFEKSDLQEEESISMLLNGVVATLASSVIASYTTGVGMLDSLNLLFDDEDEEEKKKRAKKLLYASKTDWGKRFIMPEDIAIAKYILDAKKDDKSLGKFDPLILGLAKETFMAQNRYDNYNLISMFMRDDTEKEKLLLKALPLYGAFTQLPAKQWSTVSSISPKDYDNEDDYKKAVEKAFEESRLYAPTEFAKKEGLAGNLASFIIGTIKFKADTENKGKGKGNQKKLIKPLSNSKLSKDL